jgi:hypothetical protein
VNWSAPDAVFSVKLVLLSELPCPLCDVGDEGAWRSAHRVERYSGGKRNEPAPQPETPSTHLNAVAAVQT